MKHHECANVVGPDVGMLWYCRHCEQALIGKCDVTIDRPLLEYVVHGVLPEDMWEVQRVERTLPFLHW